MEFVRIWIGGASLRKRFFSALFPDNSQLRHLWCQDKGMAASWELADWWWWPGKEPWTRYREMRMFKFESTDTAPSKCSQWWLRGVGAEERGEPFLANSTNAPLFKVSFSGSLMWGCTSKACGCECLSWRAWFADCQWAGRESRQCSYCSFFWIMATTLWSWMMLWNVSAFALEIGQNTATCLSLFYKQKLSNRARGEHSLSPMKWQALCQRNFLCIMS